MAAGNRLAHLSEASGHAGKDSPGLKALLAVGWRSSKSLCSSNRWQVDEMYAVQLHGQCVYAANQVRCHLYTCCTGVLNGRGARRLYHIVK